MTSRELVGIGATAEITAWGDGKVIKLFRDPALNDMAALEFTDLSVVWQAGLPVPKPFELIELDGCKGIVMERIAGRPFPETLFDEDDNLASVGMLARLLHHVHTTRLPEGDLQRMKRVTDVMTWLISLTDALSAEEKTSIFERIKDLPEGQALCHGDTHPYNFIIGSNGPVIIDWGAASIGCPVYDLVYLSLLWQYTSVPSHLPKSFVDQFQRQRMRINRVFLKTYQALSGLTDAELAAWIVPVAAARLILASGPDEQAALLTIVREGLATPQSDLQILLLGGDPGQVFSVLPNMDLRAGQTIGFQAEIRIGGDFGSEAAWIEIRLDHPEGQRLGICQVAGRDLCPDTWNTVMAGVYVEPGIHDICLCSKGFGTRRAWLRWIRFTSDPVVELSFTGVPLPSRVPYLGPLEDYFLGSGEVGGGGDSKGIWNYLIGPGYTFYGYIKSNETFIRREEIRLVLDGQEMALDFEMHRVRSSGIFLGSTQAGDLCLYLLEFANRGETWLPRLIIVENQSPDKSHDVMIQAYVLADGSEHRLVADRAITIAHGCDDPSVRKHALIGFAGEMADAALIDPARPEQGYRLSSGLMRLTPAGKEGSSVTTALLHGMHRDANPADHALPHSKSLDMNPEDQALAELRGMSAMSIRKDAGRCLREWATWFGSSPALARIPPGRDHDLAEGALAIIRMLQGCDGGIMATARSYMDSYIRDSAGALRGLTAFGFASEAEAFLYWTQHKFDLTQAIVCNANIGDDDNWFAGYGTPDNWAAESPALLLLTARDYFRCMTEADRQNEAWQVLGQLDRTLRYAADVQIAALIKTNGLLRFNGDETESGGAGIPLLDKPDLEHHWSMPSLALCGASLVFYMFYLQKQDLDPRAYASSLIGVTISLPHILDNLQTTLDRQFWRTDLKEYPDGFYDWYRTESGDWPSYRITNYSLFPICYETPLHHPERARFSAAAMKIHLTADGYLPVQPGSPGSGFCGHDLGYLLHALVQMNDPMADEVYQTLTCGGTMGCWGTWSEAYTGDGQTHTLTDDSQTHALNSCGKGYRTANMRPFETGINLAAIRAYLAR